MKLIAALMGCLALSSAVLAGGPSTIVSYNVRFAASGDEGTRSWETRKDQATNYLAESKCDIFGLQEVLHRQLVDVQKAFPKFRHIGVGRDDGKEAGEYSPLFYNPEKWTPDTEEQGTFWLSATPDIPGSKTWGNDIPRVCSWARLVNGEGKGLYVFNTHWDHISQPSREKAAELILKKVAARKHPKEPLVVMGDFNATTGNPAIKALLASGKLIDHGGPDSEQKLSFNLWKPGLVPGLRIDHILTSPGVKAKEFKVESNGDPVGSDHHPVILRGVTF